MRINLFIAGYGTVAKALIDIIAHQKEFISHTLNKDITVCGLCNSKNYIVNKNGIDITGGAEAIMERLSNGSSNRENNYIKAVSSFNLNNSVFVDCTASRYIADCYKDLLINKFSVVACNKIANSLNYEYYHELHKCALANGVDYRYETTVCAAMPVLEMIRRVINSGDKIIKIEAIVSGTLNYLFSSYNARMSFAQLVKQAQGLGYTEPDPRLDLSGTDVLRKFIISAREAGEKIEASDIDFKGFIPQSILQNSNTESNETLVSQLDIFYNKLEAYEPQLKETYEKAAEQNKKLRFVALLDKGATSNSSITKDVIYTETICKPIYRIALTEVDSSHPFYSLEGSDNAMLITTEHYPNGIIIKGAGAGAVQTAGGLLNDILK